MACKCDIQQNLKILLFHLGVTLDNEEQPQSSNLSCIYSLGRNKNITVAVVQNSEVSQQPNWNYIFQGKIREKRYIFHLFIGSPIRYFLSCFRSHLAFSRRPPLLPNDTPPLKKLIVAAVSLCQRRERVTPRALLVESPTC